MKRMPAAGTVSRARQLRAFGTEAEANLWAALRGRQVAGLKFRRQQRLGGYIADFACLEARLVVEADGSQHADQVEYDNQRTALLNQEGYRVLRFWNPDILTNIEGVIEMIAGAIPSPLRGEGGAQRSWEGEGDLEANAVDGFCAPTSPSPSHRLRGGPLPLPSRERGHRV